MKLTRRIDMLMDFLVDGLQETEKELYYLIWHPELIVDTSRFATLLLVLNNKIFIDELLYQINKGSATDSWLCDYLYAAGRLLDEHNVAFEQPVGLIDKLSDWILNHLGVLPMHAAHVLSFYRDEEASVIQLKKLEQPDFFLVHASCLIGLMNYDEDRFIGLVSEIAADGKRDVKLVEFCRSMLKNC